MIEKTIEISIIIPILDEVVNVSNLAKKISCDCQKKNISYEVILVCNNNNNRLAHTLERFGKKYPVIFRVVQNKSNKQVLISEGIKFSNSEYITVVDPHIKYPSNLILNIYEKIKNSEYGVVVGEEEMVGVGKLEQFITSLYKVIVGKVVAGRSIDIFSGIKIFKREIASYLDLDLGWLPFDVSLIFTARELGYSIGSTQTTYFERVYKKRKTIIFKKIFQTIKLAIMQKIISRKVYHLKPISDKNMLGAGVIYKKTNF